MKIVQMKRLSSAVVGFQGDGLVDDGLFRKIIAPETAKEAVTLKSGKSLIFMGALIRRPRSG
jgi:hypothetical protein